MSYHIITVEKIIAIAELEKPVAIPATREPKANEYTPTASKPKSYHVITVNGKDNADRIVNVLSANFNEQFYHRFTECDTDAVYTITVKFESNKSLLGRGIKERLAEIRIYASSLLKMIHKMMMTYSCLSIS